MLVPRVTAFFKGGVESASFKPVQRSSFYLRTCELQLSLGLLREIDPKHMPMASRMQKVWKLRTAHIYIYIHTFLGLIWGYKCTIHIMLYLLMGFKKQEK